MRRLARMALGAAWLACLAALAMPGEVLHYDFESRTPTGLLRDLSGAGHDGRLEGGFAEAVCGDARGLRFNGRDTQIVPTAEAGLKRDGAFTLCVAFRFTAEFLGYWDARCPVQAREAGVLVSCYRRSDGRVVAVAANLTDHASAVTLEWRGTAAGAPPPPFTLGSQEFQFIELTGK